MIQYAFDEVDNRVRDEIYIRNDLVNSMFNVLNREERPIFLSGSYFFDCAHEGSDFDFFVGDANSVTWINFFMNLGFTIHEHPSEYEYNVDGICTVLEIQLEHHPTAHVVILREDPKYLNAYAKTNNQLYGIREHYGKFPKHVRRSIFKELYKYHLKEN